MAWSGIKRRVFVSHYRGDRTEVDNFINHFANHLGIFTPYVLGANNNDDFINSDNPEYVMSRIRTLYLKDSTVTIVLVGSCTHSRRYVDWELKSSLRQSDNYIPNGLMGIILPNRGNSAYMPPRLEANWTNGHNNCYARYWVYPNTGNQLGEWIDDAYNARTTRNRLINNSQIMMKYNRSCLVHGITH
ncbi:TIR domain-containing protein [Ekhidna sp.]|uniref:TIR domain-containing protein n=1 Tax=Ekhidna sp. TaxID=2608089 RepID=UPI00329A17DE